MSYTVYAKVGQTLIKRRPVDSDQLSKSEWISFREGEDLAALAIGKLDPMTGHIKVTLDPDALAEDSDGVARELYSSGFNTWFFYGPHVEITGRDGRNVPTGKREQKPVKLRPKFMGKGKSVTIPGISAPVYHNTPIHAEKASNFTWGEATKGLTRIPVNGTISYNIVRSAIVLQKIRDEFDKPVTVNSWYRPPEVNRAIGGARDSQHLRGHAIDFNVVGLHPKQVLKHLLEWPDSNTWGLASSNVFTHIDLRGYRARWAYPF